MVIGCATQFDVEQLEQRQIKKKKNTMKMSVNLAQVESRE